MKNQSEHPRDHSCGANPIVLVIGRQSHDRNRLVAVLRWKSSGVSQSLPMDNSAQSNAPGMFLDGGGVSCVPITLFLNFAPVE
jgi:hypothetical protein